MVKQPKIRNVRGPEAIIQDAIIKYLKLRDWHVMITHGSQFQAGFPDLYCTHFSHRQRWIEVKNPGAYSFTPAQLKHFPIVNRVAGIWILTAATEAEYQKLFQPPNWYQFLPASK